MVLASRPLRCGVIAMVSFLGPLWVCGQALSQLGAAVAEKASIRQVLERQVDAWNRRDLAGYMDGYWKSPELTFFSADSITRGWNDTLARYRARYQGTGREMGNLDFCDTSVQLLTADAAFVTGHWRLQMKSGPDRHGLFTLIFRKLPEGWKIVHDHTSTGE